MIYPIACGLRCSVLYLLSIVRASPRDSLHSHLHVESFLLLPNHFLKTLLHSLYSFSTFIKIIFLLFYFNFFFSLTSYLPFYLIWSSLSTKLFSSLLHHSSFVPPIDPEATPHYPPHCHFLTPPDPRPSSKINPKSSKLKHPFRQPTTSGDPASTKNIISKFSLRPLSLHQIASLISIIVIFHSFHQRLCRARPFIYV